MQKGLEAAITQVYPNVEHRECMRHLYANFKKKFRGPFFMNKLWDAAKTYSLSEHEKLLKDVSDKREEAISYLKASHNKIWSRSKFETFNSWVGDIRYKPVLDVLDAIREKLMERFDKKRRKVQKWKRKLVPKARTYLKHIFKDLGEYKVCRSSDNRAEVKYKGNRWEVILDEKNCSCRVWKVTGLPCVHAAAFISLTREANRENFADPYFTVEKFKEAYAIEIAPMPGKDQWVHIETREKIHPPIMKRPPGRPKKNRIKPRDEPKKRHRCTRCLMFGHHARTCKNPAPPGSDGASTSTTKARKRS